MNRGSLSAELLTPCGMNCGLCKRYLAYSRGIPEEKGKIIHCQGCLPLNKKCFIKKGCRKLQNNEVKFCFECENIPCQNLDRLDKRYRKQYDMSTLENLKELKEKGAKEFLKRQEEKYRCSQCGDVISVHDGKCYSCGCKRKLKTNPK